MLVLRYWLSYALISRVPRCCSIIGWSWGTHTQGPNPDGTRYWVPLKVGYQQKTNVRVLMLMVQCVGPRRVSSAENQTHWSSTLPPSNSFGRPFTPISRQQVRETGDDERRGDRRLQDSVGRKYEQKQCARNWPEFQWGAKNNGCD